MKNCREVKKFYGDNSTPYITFLRPNRVVGVGSLRGRMSEVNSCGCLAKGIGIYNRTGRNFGSASSYDNGKLDTFNGSFFS